eukprot:813942_1
MEFNHFNHIGFRSDLPLLMGPMLAREMTMQQQLRNLLVYLNAEFYGFNLKQSLHGKYMQNEGIVIFILYACHGCELKQNLKHVMKETRLKLVNKIGFASK